MERINRILRHSDFIDYMKRIERAEQDRIFCGHDLVHFLDVCRLAWIAYLEEKEQKALFLSKEWIYAAGLLHDIGRWKQYEDKTPHEAASKELAEEVLKDCGFEQGEIEAICEAIGNHRNKSICEEWSLSGLLYRADKLSRPCFGCKAEKLCDWGREKKNTQLLV